MTAILLIFTALVLILTVILSIKSLRKTLLSAPLLAVINKLNLLPKISATEKAAIESGKVGPEKEFFSGTPNFKYLRNLQKLTLTAQEDDFINSKNGAVEQLCEMTSDDKAWKYKDFSDQIWSFIKKNKFFGMIIPKEYGGLGFSHYAHSMVLQKLSSRSAPLSVTVMVPNSLGPSELLLKYGTEKQKKYYLPRLADGTEIPCFALTEPEAGSDATSIKSSGIVFKENEKVKIKLNWEKRWITLSAKATLIGVAFKLKDPNHILGNKENLGITIALVSNTKAGIDQSHRHDPLAVPFINGPIWGKDVIIDLEDIIGGPNFIGKGWPMINECLSAGRGISLPSHYTGSAKMACTTCSAHANLRRQFGSAIGKFEGIAAPLAKMHAYTYLMEATNKQTLIFMEHYGILPVLSAIAKYNITELGRKVINHAMDITGGTGISRGPQNRLANHYISSPIGITVEGANILTRTLIIFGQGALRSHPYSYSMMSAITKKDLTEFDSAFWGFFYHGVNNYFRSIWHTSTRGIFSPSKASSRTKRHYQKLMWASSRFAYLSDIAMFSYGGKLKRKEHMTGRFADLLSWQIIGFSTISHYDNNEYSSHDEIIFKYAMEEVYKNIQYALEGIYANIDTPIAGLWFKTIGLKLLQLNPIGREQSDQLTNSTADVILNNNYLRNYLLKEIFIPTNEQDPHTMLEKAYRSHFECKPILKKIRKAQRENLLSKKLEPTQLYHQAFTLQIIQQNEFEKLRQTEQERLEALKVYSYQYDESAYSKAKVA